MAALSPYGSEQDIKDFIQAVTYARPSSIDFFLGNRTEFKKIGKAAIAYSLIAREDTEALFQKTNWIDHLINGVMRPNRFSEFGQNKLGVITFNYERSFEACMMFKLRHHYGKSEAEVSAVLNEIPIVHVHGRMGRLPWQENDGTAIREYSPDVSAKNIREAAEGIVILSEADETTSEFKKARDMIRDSTRVFYFGFAYHRDNMKRLGLLRRTTDVDDMRPRHNGTALGLTSAQANNLLTAFFPKIVGNMHHNIEKYMIEEPDFLSIHD